MPPIVIKLRKMAEIVLGMEIEKMRHFLADFKQYEKEEEWRRKCNFVYLWSTVLDVIHEKESSIWVYSAPV